MNVKKNIGLITFFAVLIVFLMFNVFSVNFLSSMRFDLTSNKLYTLSKGTIKIIAELKEPITIDFYFSKKIANKNPFLQSFGKRVQDLLSEYAKKSGGKIVLRIKEPLPFTELEDEAVSRGLRGIPINAEGLEMFFGIVIANSLTDEQTIPLIRAEREQGLEYDISQMIYSLSQHKLPTVGILTTLALDGTPDPRILNTSPDSQLKPWLVLDQIQQNFSLEMLARELELIPNHINTLMLVNPIAFSKRTLQAVDSFVMRGGRILAFIDPFSETLMPQAKAAYAIHKDEYESVEPLLASWGIAMEPKVVASVYNAKLVRSKVDEREQAVRYALWMDLDKNNFAQDDVLTSNLERITLATPGAIKQLAQATTKISALITTPKDAMLVDIQDVEKYQASPHQLLLDYQPMDQYTLAVRISGPIKSAYSDATIEESNIIVVADADLLHDHFWINFQNMFNERVGVPVASNGNFVVSALENLSGSSSLIGIRNRAQMLRPFTKINQIAALAQEEFKDKEAMLVHKLNEAKHQLENYDSKLQDSAAVVDLSLHKKARDAFKEEFLATRKELRDVRHRLTQNIENLELKIKFFSIAFMPTLVTLLGLGLWFAQLRKQQRRH
jgi:ABC-type uncharacterized transport system involved in gliding motility auxiliary subunit